MEINKTTIEEHIHLLYGKYFIIEDLEQKQRHFTIKPANKLASLTYLSSTDYRYPPFHEIKPTVLKAQKSLIQFAISSGDTKPQQTARAVLKQLAIEDKLTAHTSSLIMYFSEQDQPEETLFWAKYTLKIQGGSIDHYNLASICHREYQKLENKEPPQAKQYFDQAIIHFKAAAGATPPFMQAIEALAEIYVYKKDHKNALIYLKQLPDAIENQYTIEKALHLFRTTNQTNIQQAANIFKKCKQSKNPEIRHAAYHLLFTLPFPGWDDNTRAVIAKEYIDSSSAESLQKVPASWILEFLIDVIKINIRLYCATKNPVFLQAAREYESLIGLLGVNQYYHGELLIDMLEASNREKLEEFLSELKDPTDTVHHFMQMANQVHRNKTNTDNSIGLLLPLAQSITRHRRKGNYWGFITESPDRYRDLLATILPAINEKTSLTVLSSLSALQVHPDQEHEQKLISTAIDLTRGYQLTFDLGQLIVGLYKTASLLGLPILVRTRTHFFEMIDFIAKNKQPNSSLQCLLLYTLSVMHVDELDASRRNNIETTANHLLHQIVKNGGGKLKTKEINQLFTSCIYFYYCDKEQKSIGKTMADLEWLASDDKHLQIEGDIRSSALQNKLFKQMQHFFPDAVLEKKLEATFKQRRFIRSADIAVGKFIIEIDGPTHYLFRHGSDAKVEYTPKTKLRNFIHAKFFKQNHVIQINPQDQKIPQVVKDGGSGELACRRQYFIFLQACLHPHLPMQTTQFYTSLSVGLQQHEDWRNNNHNYAATPFSYLTHTELLLLRSSPEKREVLSEFYQELDQLNGFATQ